MLILNQPVLCKCSRNILIISNNLAERIEAFYRLLSVKVDAQELLHMVTAPPDLYIEEAGFTRAAEVPDRQQEQQLKLEVIGQLVNRMLLFATGGCTYQDRVYISVVLERLGIKSVTGFMKQMQSYFEKTDRVLQLTEGSPDGASYPKYQSRQETGKHSGRENEQKRESLEGKGQELPEEEVLTLHQVIFTRLQTEQIYREIQNIYRTCQDALWRVAREELQVYEQGRFAQRMQYNKLVNRVLKDRMPVCYESQNPYETAGGSEAGGTWETAELRLAAAVLTNLVQAVYEIRPQYRRQAGRPFLSLEHNFWHSADNTLVRFETACKEGNGTFCDSRKTDRLVLQEISIVEKLLGFGEDVIQMQEDYSNKDSIRQDLREMGRQYRRLYRKQNRSVVEAEKSESGLIKESALRRTEQETQNSKLHDRESERKSPEMKQHRMKPSAELSEPKLQHREWGSEKPGPEPQRREAAPNQPEAGLHQRAQGAEALEPKLQHREPSAEPSEPKLQHRERGSEKPDPKLQRREPALNQWEAGQQHREPSMEEHKPPEMKQYRMKPSAELSEPKLQHRETLAEPELQHRERGSEKPEPKLQRREPAPNQPEAGPHQRAQGAEALEPRLQHKKPSAEALEPKLQHREPSAEALEWKLQHRKPLAEPELQHREWGSEKPEPKLQHREPAPNQREAGQQHREPSVEGKPPERKQHRMEPAVEPSKPKLQHREWQPEKPEPKLQHRESAVKDGKLPEPKLYHRESAVEERKPSKPMQYHKEQESEPPEPKPHHREPVTGIPETMLHHGEVAPGLHHREMQRQLMKPILGRTESYQAEQAPQQSGPPLPQERKMRVKEFQTMLAPETIKIFDTLREYGRNPEKLVQEGIVTRNPEKLLLLNLLQQKQDTRTQTETGTGEPRLLHKQPVSLRQEEYLEEIRIRSREMKRLAEEAEKAVQKRQLKSGDSEQETQRAIRRIAEQAEQKMKQQLGSISEQVYAALERKLESEQRRRGL